MPVYAFSGNDELRKNEALEAELTRWEASDPSSACVRENHFGEELHPASVAESYQTPDLFAPRKVLVIHNYDKVRAEGRELLEAIEKARELLGWEPAVELDEGLERTIAW
mgnify:CR=1 FL=1